ncbi:MAG: Hint domain-containing protein, partial [Myxococcaceae bacterium]|nr:Hint domain-containing protein [Myxococcaceae bacterium]MCI0671108.1 Hint domain-containing protein [Myxococcaceae bacterium]
TELAQKTAARELRSEVAEQGSKKAMKECPGGSCLVPGKQCFVAGTLVTTEEGLKPIEEVREGELVLSRDAETGVLDWRPVVATTVTPGATVLELVLKAEDGTRETLGVTLEHPFWVEGQGWTEARWLTPGSRIRTARQAWMTTESVAETLQRATVYNFEVADFHTYFVGAHQAWVHNNCTPTPSGKGAAGGDNVVYRSVDAAGNVQYVGITNDLARRSAEHLRTKGILVEKVLGGLSRADARSVEQALIEIHKLGKDGGTLLNRINSIAKSNPKYAEALKRGYELLKKIGYE